jgi:hypothetical protein
MNKQEKVNQILTDMNNLSKAYETVEALGRVESDKDLYLLAKAIAPNSIAKSWSRNAILDTIEDVLLSRA